jgi:hypothetical protein
MEIGRAHAATLVSAQRTKLLCTQDTELRKMARILEIDVVDLSGFLERFATQTKKNEDAETH